MTTPADLKATLQQFDWIALPSGQLVPAEFCRVGIGPRQREAMGFHWEGDHPVFPGWWPPSAEALESFLAT